ncbi:MULTISPECIES: phenylalanine--tRNA ligase subunit beta [Hyphobacterium]|uniref:Phenylalanine--tRNA ligase beta subunit n=1 Tax=Hyphobacterium vulgare TaxID=1736751 RepID=A0ABV6ZVR2_9PROT
MKFTLSWLKEHLETSATLAEIEHAMTMAGLEIEGIEDPAADLSAFTVAHVKEAVPHPDADRLRVCTVDTVDGEKTIVCGAPNARAGMTAIYAPLGTYIPGADFSLDTKPRKIRGVESHGMLCSSAELGSGEDSDGIIDLQGEWKVGTPAARALGMDDPVIDFEVTPNRPDWLGVDGIARDLAAAGMGHVITRMARPVDGKFDCPVKIELDWPEACPVFAGRLIRGVRNGPSPAWLQKRLKAIGLRPINALADITNLVSYDRCRPLHVYDAAKLNGTIRARKGRGEADRFEALDGKFYVPTDAMCVIADDANCLGFGGVMGGEESGVSETTTDVFLECAWFDPALTRATGRATGIESDAKHRFERGVDTHSVRPGIEWATRLILDICGGEPSHVVVAGEEPAPPKAIEFDTRQVKRLTGLDLETTEIVRILDTLGFTAAGSGHSLTVEVPTWRRDCTQPADLVEEIARIHGFDNIVPVSLPRLPGRREPTATVGQNRARLVRRALALRGYREAVTWSFCETKEAAAFGGHGDGLALENPISSELDVMRPSALVHLLKAIQANADKGLDDPRLFEVGPIWLDDTPKGQKTVAAGVRFVEAGRHWAGTREADLFDAKADALAALDAAGAPVDSLQAAQEARAWWHPGRSGVLRLGPKNVLAEFGELHPGTLKALGIDGRVIGFEVVLDAIPQPKKQTLKARAPLQRSEQMPVRRDFAFLMDDGVAAQDVIRAAKGADKALVTDVQVFDLYRGKGVPEGKVSMALEVTLQPADRTLTDKEIEAVAAAIVASVEKATGGTLRG